MKPTCRLIVLAGGPRPAELPLTAASISVGRDDDNAIQLDDASVSRHHALLTRTERTYRIQDLGSSNGTFVNEQPIREVELRSGDRIRIGNAVFRFEQCSDAAAEQAAELERLTRQNQALAAELATLREQLTAAQVALANRAATRSVASAR